jgi:hypothetical protein
MTLSVISSDFFLPLGSVKLGRLVKSVEFPTHNYHDPPYSQAPEATPVVRSQYKRILQGESSTGFASKLTSLMSSGFSKRANTRVRIETDTVKTYILDNSEAWFMEATDFDETRRWIERAIGGDGIRLVVGFHTVTDARIVHESIEGHQLSGQVTLPVGLSLAAVGIVAPLGNIVDTAVSGNQRVLDGAKTQFLAPGEQICALQYRAVSHRWLYSKEVANLKLSKVPRWTAYEGWRHASIDEVEDEPDLLEVETEGFEQPEGDWEEEEDEDGEVLLVRLVEESDGF